MAAWQSLRVSDREKTVRKAGRPFSKSVEVGFASPTIWTGEGIDRMQHNILKSLLMLLLTSLVSPVVYYCVITTVMKFQLYFCGKCMTSCHKQDTIYFLLCTGIHISKTDIILYWHSFIHLKKEKTRIFFKKILSCLWHSFRTDTCC